MKIALLATHHAEYAANLALALAAEHEVMLVLSARNAARQLHPLSWDVLRGAMRLEVVPHHYAPIQPWIAWRLAALVRDFRPDVVHAQEHPSRAPAMAQHLLGGRFPWVTTVHDPKPHSGADAKAAAACARSYANLRARSDALIVHGEQLVREMASLLPDGDTRVAAVPHGVLRFGLLRDNDFPEVGEGPLIFFGRMNRYKGLDVLLDANDLWCAQGFTPPLIVAGAGPEIGRLKARLAAADNIELHGTRVPQVELAALVSRSVGAILPYRDATQSGVAASCFGSGKPVIATRVGCLPEVVHDGDNGLLVPPDDPEALAAVGRRFLEDAGLRSHLARGARTTAETLGWTNVARQSLDVYGRALTRP